MNGPAAQRLAQRLFPFSVPARNLLVVFTVGMATVLISGSNERRLPVPDEPPALATAVDEASEGAAVPVASPLMNGPQQALSRYLAKRYRLDIEPMEMLVQAAHAAGTQVGVDPLLILAVMAIESRFKTDAQSDMGAKGLMQVVPKYHPQVIARHGGEEAMLEPSVNILVGAHILKQYIRRAGTIEAGLQFYHGSVWDESSLYAEKVMAEMQRLSHAISVAGEAI